jgi:hypothetical protein
MTARSRARLALAAVAVAALGAGVVACSGDDDAGDGTTTTAAGTSESTGSTAAGNEVRTYQTPDGDVVVTFDGKLPAGWPTDLRLPDGTTTAGTGALTGATSPFRIAAFRTTMSPEDAFKFFTGDKGFGATDVASVGTGADFVGTAHLAEPDGSITVRNADGGTIIVITLPGDGTTPTTTAAPGASTSTTVRSGSTSSVPGTSSGSPSSSTPTTLVSGGPA